MALKELTEEQVWDLAESELSADGDWPLLQKNEWDATESAVSLKKTKNGFILGASCDQQNAIRFFFGDDEREITDLTERFVTEMERSGNPLSGCVTL